MKTGYLRHKASGARVIGTFDKVPGCARFDKVVQMPDGACEPEWIGETDMWWDDQEIELDPMTTEVLYVLEGGDVVPESECEFVEEETE